jgi:phosphoribosylformylglycinamidine cyclo-ligase
MVLAVNEANVAEVTAKLEAAGETVFPVGRIEAGEKGCTVRGSIETWSAKGDWSATHLG